MFPLQNAGGFLVKECMFPKNDFTVFQALGLCHFQNAVSELLWWYQR